MFSAMFSPTLYERVLPRVWQDWLLLFETHRIVDTFLALDLTEQRVKSMSFETLVPYLRDEAVLSATKACVQRVQMLCSRQEPLRRDVHIRVFLTAYMIAHFPTHVFETVGELETALIQCAVPLVAHFHQICESIRTEGRFVSSDLTDGFPVLLCNFMDRFKAWKVPDEAQLAVRIKGALAAMYQALSLSASDSFARAVIHTQIERLRAKLVQLKGAEELLQFDADRIAGVQFPVPRSQRRLENEQMVHELMLDPAYELKESTEAHAEELWVNMEAELRLEPPCYTLVLRTLEEIHDAILGVTNDDAIDAVMAPGIVDAHQWNNCVGFIEAIVGVMQRFQTQERDEKTRSEWEGSILPVLRDTTDANEQPRVFCQTLKFVLGWVNGMRLDTANARLRSIADVVRDRGVEYEGSTFRNKVNSGMLTLQRTEAWLLSVLPGEPLADESAMIDLHWTAMMHLIADANIEIPETLLLDTQRIKDMRQEFRFLVGATAIVVSLGQSFPLDEILRSATGLESVIEAVSLNLSCDERTSIVCRMEQCILPSDALNGLMSNRIKEVVLAVAKNNSQALHPFIQPALFDRFGALATLLKSVADLNRAVHLQTYAQMVAQLIAERA